MFDDGIYFRLRNHHLHNDHLIGQFQIPISELENGKKLFIFISFSKSEKNQLMMAGFFVIF